MSANATVFPEPETIGFAGLLEALKPLCPLSKSSLRIAGFWRASERLKPGFKISLVDSGAEVVSTLAAVIVGKTLLSRAEWSVVVAAGLASSLVSAASAFFTTGVSDTVPLSVLERSSSPIIADWIDDSAAVTSDSVASAFPSKPWPAWILACKLAALASVYNLLSSFLARERAVNNFDLSTALWWETSSFSTLGSSTFSAGALASSVLAGVTSTGLATVGAA